MSFEDYKKKAIISYTDAKREGLVDKDILRELDKFNKLKDYYTTSSCSGRILLLRKSVNDRKMMNAFYYKNHSAAKEGEIIRAVHEYDENFELWFKVEPYILHAGCRDLDSAKKLLALCRKCGIKRAGINAWGRRIIVEIIGTQHVEALLVEKGRVLVSDDYLKLLTIRANQRLKLAKKVLHSFFKGSESFIK
ncbi:hypothetical protein COX58_00610 [archaeon CG_4_10_14_0_2_um_filter_Archaea_38_6]|nr:MAG: hypothetical protein COS83_04225 [archaeon CG07_land_8_20_14_0_80_38_8]PIU88641.1 MAG: hypothetical protein COS64_03335 [archaeon CG06_land_8_20_14_3_00_37_11]PIX43782.1 MAG: hypothetical protein COZ55_00925 [archaeon CG_4_8_14_3_um_filter_38_5]PJA23016.1 MAG: hypothetical protein COX58_00610 [archaeon CG_4_10_14_0_2_um_filter_Archaea_38_6]